MPNPLLENFEADFRRMEQELVATALKLNEPWSGEGIEYLERAKPFLPTYDEYGLETIESIHRSITGMQARDVLSRRFAWAVPSERALEVIAALSPIVEVGAGGGYWAKLLRERGAQVAAYDHAPYPLINMRRHRQVAYGHYPVAVGGPERALRHHPERTLFLCWPYMNSMAADCVRLHRGEHVVYVGEGRGGCTGSDEFFFLLGLLYEEIETVGIPRWFGLHDYLSVWQRRRWLAPEIEAELVEKLSRDRYDWDDDED